MPLPLEPERTCSSWRESWIASNTVIGLAYAVAGLVGNVSGLILFGNLTAFWPSAGIALYGMLYVGRHVWPGVWFGSFVANIAMFYDHSAPLASVLTNLAIGGGSTLQAVAGRALVRRACSWRDPFERTSDVIMFIIAGLASAVVSGVVGALSMSISGDIPWSHFAGFAGTWWLGDATGILVMMPLLYVWIERPLPRDVSFSEAAILLGVLVLTSQIVFSTFGGPVHHYALSHLFLPLLTWATLRFGSHGSVTATFVVYMLAMIGTAHGRGPFIAPTDVTSLLLLQLFLLDVTITVLTLSALLTERRLLAEERAKHAEVQRLLRDRDDFIAMASHELRTPLVPLRIQLDLLRQIMRAAPHPESTNPDMKMKALASAGRQVDRLSSLVEELLDVSRMTAGRLALKRAWIDLGVLVGEVVERFRPALAKAGCTVAMNVSSCVEGEWDRSRLDQVITNLLTNAMKYGAGKPIELTVADEGKSAVLTVRDYGIGIAKDQHQLIFERFQRAASARHFHGLGLGLFISREIVVAHGGTIGVESDVARGAMFIVRLPKTQPAEGAPGHDDRVT